jgi:peptidyl-tRNA hydrolase
MRVKVLYRKNLKMSPGKLAAQVAHAVIGLGVTDTMATIVVLESSDSNFIRHSSGVGVYVHKDLGFTEVNAGEPTCLAFYDFNLSRKDE